MKIAIIDKSIDVKEYFFLLLEAFDCEVYFFNNNKELKEDFDFIFFSQKEKIFVKGFKIFISFRNEVFNYCDYVMSKSITPEVFKKIFPMLIKLKKYIDEQNFILSYKETQELIAIKKQLKFMKNTLQMYYDNNHHLIQSYLKPKDI
jgi:hypothetical protein